MSTHMHISFQVKKAKRIQQEKFRCMLAGDREVNH
jgi:hypothetical protein